MNYRANHYLKLTIACLISLAHNLFFMANVEGFAWCVILVVIFFGAACYCFINFLQNLNP